VNLRSILLLLTCCCVSAGATERVNSHADFFAAVARDEGMTQAFIYRDQVRALPNAQRLKITGIAPGWGSLVLQTNALTVNQRAWTWRQARQVFGRPTVPTMDLELTSVFEAASASSGRDRICLQAPTGSSGSAARWQHVVVIERSLKANAPPSMITWTAPYASCAAVFVNTDGQLVAGTFDLQLESEQAFSTMLFKLQSVSAPEHVEWPRYLLSLRTPGNAFDFTPSRLPTRPRPN
jgi:hypothetical protein